MSHVYCPECGFQNLESAHYCSRCGALLVTESEPDDSTLTFSAEEVQEHAAQDELDELGIEGPALVVRSGGGRTGEQFSLDRPTTTIGRTPDCDIFFDDVTVSRRHAAVSRTDSGWVLEDLGSLNGTFLNRSRVDRGELESGDEVQIGKYRLVFFER